MDAPDFHEQSSIFDAIVRSGTLSDDFPVQTKIRRTTEYLLANQKENYVRQKIA